MRAKTLGIPFWEQHQLKLFGLNLKSMDNAVAKKRAIKTKKQDDKKNIFSEGKYVLFSHCLSSSFGDVAISSKRIAVAGLASVELPKAYMSQTRRQEKVFEAVEAPAVSTLKKSGDNLKVVGRGTGGSAPQIFSVEYFLNPDRKANVEAKQKKNMKKPRVLNRASFVPQNKSIDN